MELLKSKTQVVALAIAFSSIIAACDKTSAVGEVTAADSKLTLTVYKSPTCGCCGNWIDYMKAEGFQIKQEEHVDISPIKKKYNIKPEFQSCHTAVYEPGGYFFEGHIPADVIKRFLSEKPEGAAGLFVPGMPVGSPGMEYGDIKVDYDVYVQMDDGNTKVYQHIDHKVSSP